MRCGENGVLEHKRLPTPFLRPERGWVPAELLQAGEDLFSLSTELLPVSFTTQLLNMAEPVQVFNMHVEGACNYFVGTSRVLVHNMKTPGEDPWSW